MQTETLEVRLPVGVVKRLRERVRLGEFPNESTAVQISLEQSESVDGDEALPLLQRPFDPARPAVSATVDEWENQILPERLAKWEAGNRKTLTQDEVRERLIALHASLNVSKAA